MRGIIIATGYRSPLASLLHYRPTPLLQVVDKPIIFHVIEFLKQHGITDFDIILSHLPYQVEKFLEQGQRWGIKITYYLVPNPATPLTSYQPAAKKRIQEEFLLASGDLLPRFNFDSLVQSGVSTALVYPDKSWTGWGLFSGEKLALLAFNGTEIPNGCKTIKALPFLSAESFAKLYRSNVNFINEEPTSALYPSTAKMVQPNIWISHGASVDQTVLIIPPVFIGEETHINPHCQIGPNAIIENHCLIDTGSVIEEALICQNSYVGEKLEVRKSIIDRNLFINISLDTHIFITDDFILSEMKYSSLKKYLLFILERLCALACLGIASPILLLIIVSGKWMKKEAVQLPSNQQNTFWKTFSWIYLTTKNNSKNLCDFLIGLINVVRGYAHIVGLPPRSPDEIALLPEEWRHLYLRSRIGLITLAQLERIDPSDLDGLYTAEMFYSVRRSLTYDLALLIRWIKSLFSTG